MTSISDLFASAAQAQRAGRFPEATGLYEQVVRADPRHAMAWHQLGCIAMYSSRCEAALEFISRAIRLDGGRADFHHNMGACCRMLGRLDEAQASYEQCLRLKGRDVITEAHLCLTLYGRGERAAARRLAAQILQCQRTTPEEHSICGVLLLLEGKFAEGWAEHEWRLEVPPIETRAPREHKWDGGPLGGRTILVHAEQGYGDTLQCVRYLPQVIARGGRPILAVHKPLIPLLSEANLCPTVPWEEPWPAAEVYTAVFSLPHALGTTLESVPADIPYLQPSQPLVAAWKKRLAHLDGFRVGVHWQGSRAFKLDRVRSIPLAAFKPLAQVPGVRLISLQKNLGCEQLTQLGGSFEVCDFGDELDTANGPFMDSAAVMKNLDLVITCDTASAHLAGALGVNVWVALSTMADFRWMLDREDTPWYPTMRLFRQSTIGDWPEVFARMAAELRANVADLH